MNHRQVDKQKILAFLQDSLDQRYPERSFISSKLLTDWKLQLEFSRREEPMDWNKLMPLFINFGKTLANAGAYFSWH